MRTVTSLLATILLLAALPAGALSQLHLGGQASMAFDRPADESTFGVGARLALGFPALPLEIHGSADYFFPDCGGTDCTYWEANANAILRLPLPGAPLGPYFGAGLHYQSFSADGGLSGFIDSDASGTGFNILGGLELGATPLIRPFIEGRYEIIDSDGLDNQFVITAGIIL